MAPGMLFGINITGDKHEFDPDLWKNDKTNGTNHANGDTAASDSSVHTQLPNRHPATGIDVLVVGAGMGGLMTTLECWRKGHNIVGILERSDGPVYSGDIIVIQPSAVSIFRHWPDLMRDLEDEQVNAGVTYEKHSGEHIYGPTVPNFNEAEHLHSRKGPKFVAPAQVRQRFYRMLLRQVAKLGLKVDYGKRVSRYFEDKAAGKGGVLLETGEIQVADVVVAADGLRSSSEVLIFGEHTPPKSSGMSIYRISYPREMAMKNDLVRKRWGNSPAMWEYWLGPGMYIGIFISDDIVGWGFTPRDTDGTAPTESWEPDTSVEDVLKALLRAPDWDPAIPALISTAPKKGIVHWPLLWRDLRREWTSAGGHVVQVGDSAHSFTPTSGNGATQALEDAITLATCLELSGGPRRAPLATKIYNLLRYERISCAQKMTFVNSQLKTETNWDAIWKDPAKVKTRFPKWVWSHDPEQYAYEKYSQGFAHLVAGEPFENTNFPSGHKFVPWTIEEVYRDIAAGKRVEDLLDGDWS
ncbi:putative monooxygenase [Pyrenochaeta sp. MPI-SDFR-AT-0127]|nr:putative monooxygenase [Pyrenochaeta sp. MPI-SDFR-AT-0127]